MSLRHVKIFGERNTATNALKALIETNSEATALPGVSSEIDPAIVERLRLLRTNCHDACPSSEHLAQIAA